MTNEINDICNRIAKRFPQVRAEVEETTSGTTWLNFHSNCRTVTMEFAPDGRIGVSNIADGSNGFVGHDFHFNEPREAEECVISVFSDTAKVE